MDKKTYYLKQGRSYPLIFSIYLPFPKGIEEIREIRAHIFDLIPLSRRGEIYLKGWVIISFQVLIGSGFTYRGEEKREFHLILPQRTSPLYYLFSSWVEVDTLYVHSINQRGLITSLGVELEIMIKEGILKEAPAISKKRFFLKTMGQVLRKDFMVEKELQKGRDWKKITHIDSSIKYLRARTLSDKVSFVLEVELGIYYLGRRETLFLVHQDHTFCSFFPVTGVTPQGDVQIRGHLKSVYWKESRGVLLVQLHFSLQMAFSTKGERTLPVLEGANGRRFYLKAILEQGEGGFLLEEEVTLKEPFTKVKRLLPELFLKEKEHVHKGLFLRGLLKIWVCYLNERGAIIWETFSFPWQGELPTKTCRGEVQLKAVLGEVLWELAPKGLSLTIPLHIHYFLTKEAPYHLILGDDMQVEALEYLGKKKETLSITCHYTPPFPIKLVEKIEADPVVKKLHSLREWIYLEGSIHYQVYYLSKDHDGQRYFSFYHPFQKEYRVQDISKDLSLEASLTLDDLDYNLQQDGEGLRILSFWKVDLIFCQEGNYSFSYTYGEEGGFSLKNEGLEKRIFTDHLDGTHILGDPLKIERVEVEILFLKANGTRIQLQYRYHFYTNTSPSTFSKGFIREILLPLIYEPNDPITLDYLIQGVAFFLDQKFLQIQFQLTLFYHHFTRV